MSEDRPKIEYHAGSTADFDKCEYLFLRGLSEPSDNCLQLVVEEATGGRDVEPLVIRKTSVPRQAIETLPGCRAFVVEWRRYIAYTVSNESKASFGNSDDKFEGRLFREYSSSGYLSFIRSHSWVFEEEDPRHWGVYCLNHSVDVVSLDAPEIRFAYVRPSPDLVGVKGWPRPTE